MTAPRLPARRPPTPPARRAASPPGRARALTLAAASLGALAAAAGATACGSRGAPTASPGEASPAAAGERVTRTSEAGPVRATISAWPARPTLGDPIHLELVVEAEPGVEVTMPAFGEALGRFPIVEFVPRQAARPGGGAVFSQRYTLEAPMSGPGRIPRLLVEFIDRRPGRADAGPAAGGAPAVGELETEELTVEIQSASADAAAAEALRPARGPLPELAARASLGRRLLPWGIGALSAAIAVVVLAVAARARRRRRRTSAFDEAAARLAALEARGMPVAAAVDPWYVELSDIVRRYLEDRFGVRAPELTTEEFLRELGRTDLLAHEHKRLLADFLERCDRVKFAAYQPREAESRDALDAARRFLGETRPAEPGAPGPVEGGAAAAGGRP